ncbi:hypothetical protein XFF6992_270054 [Xanthomonas citri pv. fuscans]|nr:hypothetical protein XFF6992_270054 [Xanthomonas citri pv. fuscans]
MSLAEGKLIFPIELTLSRAS